MNFEQLCALNGYKFEEYEVTTQDGYILSIFRIPGLVGEKEKSGFDADGNAKPVVLFWHGMFNCADAWIINVP